MVKLIKFAILLCLLPTLIRTKDLPEVHFSNNMELYNNLIKPIIDNWQSPIDYLKLNNYLPAESEVKASFTNDDEFKIKKEDKLLGDDQKEDSVLENSGEHILKSQNLKYNTKRAVQQTRMYKTPHGRENIERYTKLHEQENRKKNKKGLLVHMKNKVKGLFGGGGGSENKKQSDMEFYEKPIDELQFMNKFNKKWNSKPHKHSSRLNSEKSHKFKDPLTNIFENNDSLKQEVIHPLRYVNKNNFKDSDSSDYMFHQDINSDDLKPMNSKVDVNKSLYSPYRGNMNKYRSHVYNANKISKMTPNQLKNSNTELRPQQNMLAQFGPQHDLKNSNTKSMKNEKVYISNNKNLQNFENELNSQNAYKTNKNVESNRHNDDFNSFKSRNNIQMNDNTKNLVDRKNFQFTNSPQSIRNKEANSNNKLTNFKPKNNYYENNINRDMKISNENKNKNNLKEIQNTQNNNNFNKNKLLSKARDKNLAFKHFKLDNYADDVKLATDNKINMKSHLKMNYGPIKNNVLTTTFYDEKLENAISAIKENEADEMEIFKYFNKKYTIPEDEDLHKSLDRIIASNDHHYNIPQYSEPDLYAVDKVSLSSTGNVTADDEILSRYFDRKYNADSRNMEHINKHIIFPAETLLSKRVHMKAKILNPNDKYNKNGNYDRFYGHSKIKERRKVFDNYKSSKKARNSLMKDHNESQDVLNVIGKHDTNPVF